MLHQHKRSSESRSDEWWTPSDLFWELCYLYRFFPQLDVCATKANRLCGYYFSKRDNALKRDWIKGKIKRKCWCNPPNSLMKYFIKQAYQQFNLNKIKTMMVVPLNVQSSKSFWKFVQRPMESGEKIMVRPIENRRKFLFKGQDTGTSINGYCVVIFGRSNRFMKNKSI